MGNKDIKGNKVIKAALFGGLIGGITGLLLAPKSGQELRQDITLQVHELGDKAVGIKDKAQSAWQNIGDKTQVSVKTGKNLIEKGKHMAGNLKILITEIQHGALTKTNSVDGPEEKVKNKPIEVIVSSDKPIELITPDNDSLEEIMIIENEHEC
ncbi:YtxH domain-containing protein [Desulfosporosinus youngiae]|uniref:YtxH domain-containing protein n=1 Tax=Desulfosporosinus youngiae TaxID=339862 RepID=UPI00031D11CF|nr:YtxH domain-containing protein [Desulfosporosinus youngiae]